VPHRLRRPDAGEKVDDHAVPQKFSDERENHEDDNIGQNDGHEVRIGVASLLGVPGVQKSLNGCAGGSSNDARHFLLGGNNIYKLRGGDFLKKFTPIKFTTLFLGTFFEKVHPV